MIAEDDFEVRVATMLSRRALDIEDGWESTSPDARLYTKHDRPTPNRSRIGVRVLVAASVLAIGGVTALLVTSPNSGDQVVTRATSETSTPLATATPQVTATPPALVLAGWGTSMPSEALFPASFSLAEAQPFFSVGGTSDAVASAYVADRFIDSDSLGVSATLAEIADDRETALYRWTWSNNGLEGASGWIYLRFVDQAWRVVASTTDGVDSSQVSMTARGVSGRTTSIYADSLAIDVLTLDANEPVPGSPFPDGAIVDSPVAFGTAGFGGPVVDIKINCVNQAIVRTALIAGTYLSISELVLTHPGPIAQECVPNRDTDGIPLPLLVLSTDELSPSLELAELTAFLVEAGDGSTKEPDTYIQTFRSDADRFEGPMVLIETSSAGIGLGGGLESFAANGLTFYILQTETRAHVLRVDGPGLVTATVTGANMALDELVTFTSRMSAPPPGSLAWTVLDGGPLIEVFAGSPAPADQSLESANTVGVWTPDQGGSTIILFVEAANQGRFESSIVTRMARGAPGAASTEVINGRTFVIIERPDSASAIWMENSDAVGTLDTTRFVGDIPIRELLGALDEVTQSQWRDLGGTVARTNADDQSTATTEAPTTTEVLD